MGVSKEMREKMKKQAGSGDFPPTLKLAEEGDKVLGVFQDIDEVDTKTGEAIVVTLTLIEEPTATFVDDDDEWDGYEDDPGRIQMFCAQGVVQFLLESDPDFGDLLSIEREGMEKLDNGNTAGVYDCTNYGDDEDDWPTKKKAKKSKAKKSKGKKAKKAKKSSKREL